MQQVVTVDEQADPLPGDDLGRESALCVTLASNVTFALVVSSWIQDTSGVNGYLAREYCRLDFQILTARIKNVRLHLGWVLLVLVVLLCGCALLPPRFVNSNQDGQVKIMPNPMVIPVSNMEFTWHQLVDMMDDYFEIASEQRLQEIDGRWIEGRITSKPLVGATCLEPLRRDSVGWYERLHSTLQSTRRTAHMRVIPAADGLEIQLEVLKELEDVSQPEYSTVTSAVERYDGSLVPPRLVDDDDWGPETLGWIHLGRDEALEQAMLRNLHARLYESVELAPPNNLY